MNLRSFINILLSFTWSVALVCLFVIASWLLRLDWIDQLDSWTKDRILTEPVRIFDEIILQQRVNPNQDRTIRNLESLANRLSSVQKNAVLDPILRATLSQLVWIYQKQNDFFKAGQWAALWRKHDPYDLNAQIQSASIMMTSEENYSEGKNIFTNHSQRFPELLGLAASYALALAKAGNFAEAFLIFTPFFEPSTDYPLVRPFGALPHQDWDVGLFSDNESPPRTSRNWSISGQQWILHVQSGPKIDRIVFQIPDTSILYIHSVTIFQNGTEYQLPFQEMQHEGLSVHSNRLWKPNYGPASLTLRPTQLTPDSFSMVIRPVTAPPAVLIDLIRAPIGPITLSQLEKLSTESVSQFQMAQSLLDLWIEDE